MIRYAYDERTNMYVVHDADLAEAEDVGVNEVFPLDRLPIMRARCEARIVDFVEAPLPVKKLTSTRDTKNT